MYTQGIMGSPADYLPRDLTEKERNDLLDLDAELARMKMRCDGLVFVLGSYHPAKKPRLVEAGKVIQRSCRGTVIARLMEQFLDDGERDIPGHMKFRAIANRSDALVGVVEDDQGGFTYEQGIITDRPELFNKTFVLKRSYAPPIERARYSWMQSTSLFAELERYNRIYEWDTDRSYSTSTRRVAREIDKIL